MEVAEGRLYPSVMEQTEATVIRRNRKAMIATGPTSK